MFSDQHMRILKYCSEEVARQHASPVAVYWMMKAWNYTYETCEFRDAKEILTSKVVAEIGRLVEPIMNMSFYRQCGVTVGNHYPPHWQEVPRLMDQLFQYGTLSTLTPEEVYKEFQMIHPFRDGNGRTGKIIYNALSGTLSDPKMPPNFFNCSNP